MNTVSSIIKSVGRNERGVLLIVEDETDMRSIVSIHASSMGYEVKEASNGVEAIEILENNDVDVIISDMLMPRMSGYELLQEIRNRGCDIPFIGLSGLSEKKIILECMKLDIFDYLEKPFDSGSLKLLIKEAFHMAFADKELGGGIHLITREKFAGEKRMQTPEKNEFLIRRLKLLSEKGVPTQVGDDKKDYSHLAENERLLQMFVDEGLEQLTHSEKAIRTLGKGNEVQWELGYLNRVMTILKRAAELTGEKDIVRLIEAIRQTLAVYRVRKRLMQHRQLKDLRHAHKLLMIMIKSLREETPPDLETLQSINREVELSIKRMNEALHKQE